MGAFGVRLQVPCSLFSNLTIRRQKDIICSGEGGRSCLYLGGTVTHVRASDSSLCGSRAEHSL